MAYARTAANGASASGAGTTCANTITLTSGRLAIAAGEWNSTSLTASLADDRGNTWTPIAASLATTATGAFRCQLFWSIIATGGSTIVTLTTSGSTTSRLLDVVEYSGGPASSPVEGGNAASGTSSVSSVAITTTNDHDLVIGHTVVAGAAGGVTGAAWSEVLATNDNSTGEALDITPAGVATFQSNSSNSWWAASIAAFALSPVGGATQQEITGTAAGTGALSGGLSAGVQVMGVGTAATAASGDLVVDYPTGVGAPLVDDIIVIDVSARDNVSLTFPAGWTKKAEANNGTGLRQTIAYHRRAGGESETSITVTHTAGAQIIGRAVVVRGAVSSGDPFEAATGPTSVSAASTGVFPDVTTIGSGVLLFYAFAYADDYATAPAITNAQGLTLTERDSTEVA